MIKLTKTSDKEKNTKGARERNKTQYMTCCEGGWDGWMAAAVQAKHREQKT